MNYVPVVDIQRIGLFTDGASINDADYNEVGGKLYKALSEVGFAYLKNSGFTDDYINEVQAKYDEFFAMDVEEKEKYNFGKVGTGTGYTGIGAESVSKSDLKEGKDYKETFDIDGDVISGFSKVSLPDDKVEGFTASCFSYAEKCKQLANRLFVTLSHGMKLKDCNYLSQRHNLMNKEGNHTPFRSNFYPPLNKKQKKTLNQRLGAHSDFGSFTLLFQDKVGGLQVETENGEFVDVSPIPDTIVMNIANIMNIWTDGRLRSTVHRVVLPREENSHKVRRSLAYFVFPNDDVPIEQLEYKENADPPRPDRKMFQEGDGDAPKTSREWTMRQLDRIQNVEKYHI